MSRQVQISNEEMRNKRFSPEAADCINKLLIRKPEQRLGNKGIGVIKSHPWFRGFMWNELSYKNIVAPFIPDFRDNFDKKYCEAIEDIGIDTNERYNEYINDPRYSEIFYNYTYYKNDPYKEIIQVNTCISRNIKVDVQNNRTVTTPKKTRCQSALLFSSFSPNIGKSSITKKNKTKRKIDIKKEISKLNKDIELSLFSRNQNNLASNPLYHSLSRSDIRIPISHPTNTDKQKAVDVTNKKVNQSSISPHVTPGKIIKTKYISYLNQNNLYNSNDENLFRNKGGITSRNKIFYSYMSNNKTQYPKKISLSPNNNERTQSLKNKSKNKTNHPLSYRAKPKKNAINSIDSTLGLNYQLFSNLNMFLPGNKTSRPTESKKEINKIRVNPQLTPQKVLINKIISKCKKTPNSSHTTVSTSSPIVVQKN